MITLFPKKCDKIHRKPHFKLNMENEKNLNEQYDLNYIQHKLT